MDPAQINFANWTVIGAKALVKGSVSQSGGSLAVEVRLYDVGQHMQIGGERYSGSPELVARMARRFADKIMEYPDGRTRSVRFADRLCLTPRRSREGDPRDVRRRLRRDDRHQQPRPSISLPSWSPDAGSILFTSFMDGNASLYRADVPPRSDKSSSSSRGLNLGGRWSPDGRGSRSASSAAAIRTCSSSTEADACSVSSPTAPRSTSLRRGRPMAVDRFRLVPHGYATDLRDGRGRFVAAAHHVPRRVQHLALLVAEGRPDRICRPRRRDSTSSRST